MRLVGEQLQEELLVCGVQQQRGDLLRGHQTLDHLVDVHVNTLTSKLGEEMRQQRWVLADHVLHQRTVAVLAQLVVCQIGEHQHGVFACLELEALQIVYQQRYQRRNDGHQFFATGSHILRCRYTASISIETYPDLEEQLCESFNRSGFLLLVRGSLVGFQLLHHMFGQPFGSTRHDRVVSTRRRNRTTETNSRVHSHETGS
mmetsp:Transcript_51066/g.128142  ORF Transcript_51066/g.128142 Transcript_51066/m.128142 type:complete len:202 (+) Transcript_51066:771-1376(+)